MLHNTEIRARAKEKGVKLYELAAYLGKSQAYITRKLYFELDRGEKEKLLTVIDEVAAGRRAPAGSNAMIDIGKQKI